MGHGSMFGRVIQWLANEIIVKGLSENPAFQRFAVRSSQQMQDLTKSAAEAAKSLSASENVVQLRKVRILAHLFTDYSLDVVARFWNVDLTCMWMLSNWFVPFVTDRSLKHLGNRQVTLQVLYGKKYKKRWKKQAKKGAEEEICR